MFESLGEVLILGLAVLVTFAVAWAIAERRAGTSLTGAYEPKMLSARRRIDQLEHALGGAHLYPTEPTTDFELDSIKIVDSGWARTA